MVMAGEESELLVGIKNEGNGFLIPHVRFLGLFGMDIWSLFCKISSFLFYLCVYTPFSLPCFCFFMYFLWPLCPLLLSTLSGDLTCILKSGESNVNVIAVHASVHFPYDHHMLVQNLSTQVIMDSLLHVWSIYMLGRYMSSQQKRERRRKT